jgi:hypothetical protein
MPTAIFFNGQRIVRPGAYSKIDASALASVSPAAVGIVAIIGTAEGGKPLSVDPVDSDHTRSETVLTRYRSGNLRTAGQFAFQPANDPAIPGGAQRLVAVKVNPATQATATLPDSTPTPSVLLTSKDYGAFTNQISVEVATGTTLGKRITVQFEGTVEDFDDVGGLDTLSVAYPAAAGQWDSASLESLAASVRLNLTRADIGLVNERTADMSAPLTVTYVSSDAGDITQTVTLYGLDAATLPVSETRTLNGLTPVAGTQVFSKVTGCRKSAATIGTVTVADTSPITVFSLAPGVLTRGLLTITAMPVASALAISVDVLVAAIAVIRGKSATNTDLVVKASLLLVVPATAVFSSITQIELGDVPVARTVTEAGSVTFAHSTVNTVQKLLDGINQLTGFTATSEVANPTTFLPSDFDRTLAAVSATPGPGVLTADLFYFIEILNSSSAFVGGTRLASPNGVMVPANTPAPVFLGGAIEGVPTITEYQTAFTLLKKRRVNIIVPLTGDPAVASLLLTHLIERAGKLRSEANGYIGLENVAQTAPPDLARIKTLIQQVQSRHISALAQEPQRFDPDTGQATFYRSWMYAVIAAGMQAGSPIGEPLTRKLPLVTDTRQDTSWTSEDNGDELLDAGLMFSEKVDNIGIRFVRSLTTYLADDNVVFSEMSANESANTAVFRLRTGLDRRIGSRGLRGTAAALKSLANDELSRMIDEEIIFDYRALTVEQIGDVFPISVEIAPVLPVNFIPITVHLVAARAAA